jgi:hypothetical protein
LKFRFHIFSDEGFSARVLVTRPGVCFRADVWASDLRIISGQSSGAETDPVEWFNRVMDGIRNTGAPVLVVAESPNTSELRFLIQPENTPS